MPISRSPTVSAPGRVNQYFCLIEHRGGGVVRQLLDWINGVMVAYYRNPMEKVRISKLMAQQGLCSRREADRYLELGLVRVDGQVVGLGDKALPGQRIELHGKATAQQDARVTILIHKPIGLVSGQAEDGYLPAVTLFEPQNQCKTDRSGVRFNHAHRRGLAVAGRLDIDSSGLLVLTQDGRIARQLIGEDSEIEKEYLVRVKGRLGADGLQRLRHGLTLDGKALKPAKVEWLNDDQLKFILREGRKRQIRRMCELVGLQVVGLKRVRVGRVRLGELAPGKWRYLRADESF